MAGYSIINDVSVRDWQVRTGQFLSGKTFERSTPLGPTLVTHGEVLYPGELAVQCEVDGEVVQQGNTSDLLFGIVELVCYLSQIFTLDPRGCDRDGDAERGRGGAQAAGLPEAGTGGADEH